MRWQCSKSVSQIFKQTGITPSGEVFEVLKKFTKDGDYDVEFTCAEALGNATLTNPQRLDLSNFRRIEREVYGFDDP